MSVGYFPVTPSSTVEKETSSVPTMKTKAEDVQAAYVGQRDAIVGALDDTSSLLKDLKTFVKDSWVVRYPTFKPTPDSPLSSRPGMRQTLSFADEPTKEHPVHVSAPSLKRSVTLAALHEEDPSPPETDDEKANLIQPADLQILRLDLKLGPHGSSTSPAGLVTQLEKASIANLIEDRISSSLSHLAKLRTRVSDTSSKVLVTGDLNAGKSTLVNALLGRDVMPVDQQPLTSLFCEVRDAAKENDGVEEAHIVNDEGRPYDREDEGTFTRVSIDELESVVAESDVQRVLKLYLHDPSLGSKLLHNGAVDISLIDAPGLNRDSLQTTELFARQEEIDVVVFVVSAENHFTLSAKEFLFNASNEKAYIFVVVNKYDQIKDKAKCRRLVSEQIKQLSPRTWEDSEDLVHFVDSQSALARAVFPSPEAAAPAPPTKPGKGLTPVPPETFEKMEGSLRDFILVKRARSKLLPAVTYITHVLSDVDLLISTNRIVATHEKDQATSDLARSKPVLEKMKAGRTELEDGLDDVEENVSGAAHEHAMMSLGEAMDRVGRGEVGVTHSMVNAPSSRQTLKVPSLPAYPGVFGIWEYCQEVRSTLVSSLELAVSLTEDDARALTAKGVEKMFDIASSHLPENADRHRRVFVPEAMFSPRRRPGSQAIVAGGVHGLGIGFAQKQELLEVSVFDVLAVNHHLAKHLGLSVEEEEEEEAVTKWGLMSLGVGAFTMVGGKAVGIRGFIEGLSHIGDIVSNDRTRRYIAPVLGAVTLGLTVYLILELPKTIPKSIGRQIKASLNDVGTTSSLVTPQPPFVDRQAKRIERETRKVLKLAGWDSRERFRGALEVSAGEVKVAEESLARASGAIVWFDGVEERVDCVREGMREVREAL